MKQKHHKKTSVSADDFYQLPVYKVQLDKSYVDHDFSVKENTVPTALLNSRNTR